MSLKRRKLTRLLKERQRRLEAEFRKNGTLRFQLSLARELGMTLGDLRERITEEEMMLWSLMFAEEARERDEQQRKAGIRRR